MTADSSDTLNVRPVQTEPIATPIVYAKDGGVRASSRDIAAAFGKQHKHVLDKVDSLLRQAPDLAPNFRPMVVDVQIGSGATRQDRAFEMDRKAFSLLAMRFTGPKALAWQLAYIDAFDRMEEALTTGHGVVEQIGPGARSVIGGVVKGIVHKEMAEALPALIQPFVQQLLAAEIAGGHYGIARGLTAGEVLGEAGVKNRKGLRGLARRVSDHLRRHCSELNVVVPLKSLGTSTAYVFDLQVVRAWLLNGGRQLIERWVDERRGQGSLKLVKVDG